MQIIHLHHPLNPNIKFKGPIVLAMGFFDGLHLGHRQVIMTAKKIAERKEMPLAVLTYNHSPKIIYQRMNELNNRYLTLNSEKMRILKHWGVQIVYMIDYTASFQSQSPQQFINNYLIRFKADTVVAGANHTYGPRKIANMKLLPKYVNGKIHVVSVPCLNLLGKRVSSTRIRHDLDQGFVKVVDRLLGRPFCITGTVVRGYQRGRNLGFPTINIEADEHKWLPGIGVYVTAVTINHRRYEGMASIGRNSTFGSHNPITVEINLFDFNQNVYGEKVKVDWLVKLRNQINFSNVSSLVDQLKLDQKATRKYFLHITR